jgi:hypothetical protein
MELAPNLWSWVRAILAGSELFELGSEPW